MSQHYNDNDGNEGYYGEDDYDQQQYENTSLPPIEKNNGVAPQHNQHNQHSSPNTGKKIPVHERLYDPDYRKNRSIPTEPEPIYVREFKSRPPKKLEHVKSKHMDPNLWEPRGEYILETDEEPQSPQFKAKLPKGMEHIESRHMNPEYQKKRQSSDESAGEEQPVPQFHARIPKGMEHVQSKILDAKYYQEKPPPEEEHYDTEFRARPPKKLESVQSRIMDPRYFQEKVYPEEEKPDVEFKARLPKKLEHVQSRLLDPPKKPKVNYEEADTISLPSFRAKPPRHLEQVSSRILDPHYFEPKPHDPSHEAEDKYDHNFKAKIPKGMQHVESRALDPKYYRKKIPPIPTEEREAQSINHNFKASPPKQLAHIQSRAFDPAYNRALSPRSGSPIVELKQRGGVVVINVKKDPERRSKSQGYKEKMVSPRGQYNNYHNRQEGGSKSGLGLVEEPKGSVSEKKEPKRWRPPRKPKVDKVNKEFFDSWVVSPTTIYHDNSDMFYRNRQEVSEMWTSLARTIKKTVVENGERIRPIERTYY